MRRRTGADLLVVNARLLGARGSALAVRGGSIAWIGEAAAAREWRSSGTEVVDAGGGLLLPGFEDAHSHPLDGARTLDWLDLYPLATLDEIQAAVRTHARAHPDEPWVLGRGWLYGAIPGGLPTRDQLDAAVPDRPVYLECFDGHTGWANSAGLRAAGIGRDTPDPPHGEVVRDAGGAPAGALKEAATALVEAVLPRPSVEDDVASLRRAIAGHHAAGITAVQDAWTNPDELPVWRRLEERGDLAIRVRLALPMEPDLSLRAWRDRLDELEAVAWPLRAGAFLRAGILKSFADGVVEAKTAAMLEPYAGDPGDPGAGTPEWEPAALDAHVAEADRRGWQVEIHAIGDRGVRMALDAYERARATNGPWTGRPNGDAGPPPDGPRHRIEHVETVARADIGRFAPLGVVASMQPYHADPAPGQSSAWLDHVGPERAGRAWAWRSLADAGATLAFGSDWPVVPYDPILGLNTAVNRTTTDGRPAGGSLPAERLPLEAALVAWTLGPAIAAHAEHRRGRLAVGLDADLVALDRDLLAAGASAIIGTGVRLTVVGGRIVYRREDVS